MPNPTVHPSHTLLKILGILILALILISAGAAYFGVIKAPQTLSESIRTGDVERPAYTEEVNKKITSKGFQALISYTDNGFEPSRVKLVTGDTARFTNNSSNVLTLVIDSESNNIAPQDFFEYTFDKVGDVEFSSGLNNGVVSVTKRK